MALFGRAKTLSEIMQEQQNQMAQAQYWPSLMGGSLHYPPLGLQSGFATQYQAQPTPISPLLHKDKLESLKAAEPRRILAKVPDLVEVITAWRGWGAYSGLLHPLGMSTGAWQPKKKIEAECGQPKFQGCKTHSAPHKDCVCGIWAFKNLDILAKAAEPYPVINVLGKVSLWGRVIECENGYRAQFAYPAELWLLDPAMEDLGLIYGVPVRTA